MAKVAHALLADPPIGPDDDMSMHRFKSLLTVINLGQQAVRDDPLWRRDVSAAKAKWQRAETVTVKVRAFALALWCRCKPAIMRRRLDRFMLPVAGRAAPIIDYRISDDGRVRITVAAEWAQWRELWSVVNLDKVPLDYRSKCRAYLLKLVPDGMSSTRKRKRENPPCQQRNVQSFWPPCETSSVRRSKPRSTRPRPSFLPRSPRRRTEGPLDDD
jgi:hypothetical protein